jgi:hypothetical protein
MVFYRSFTLFQGKHLKPRNGRFQFIHMPGEVVAVDVDLRITNSIEEIFGNL